MPKNIGRKNDSFFHCVQVGAPGNPFEKHIVSHDLRHSRDEKARTKSTHADSL